MVDANEEYIAINTHSYPAGAGEVFVWDYTKGVFQIIPESLLRVLQVVNRFRTLQAHRDELIDAGWQDDGFGNIEDILNELVQKGLLRSKESFLEALSNIPAPASRASSIRSLGWVTRNRPELLKRSVESFIDNCVDNNRSVQYKVFDDSPEEQTRERNRRALAELAAAKGAEVLYAGKEEKRDFAELIMRKLGPQGLPKEVLDFALFDPFEIGYTVGANSNAFLLATAGELSLLVDDDVVSEYHGSPEAMEGLALSSSTDPTCFRFFTDRTELLEKVEILDLCILEQHERLLGRPISECLESTPASGTVDVSRVAPDFVRQLEVNPGKVTITMSGVCGDSGMGSSRMLLGMIGENREALLATEESYRSALVSREVLRVVEFPTLGQGGLLMTMNCGIDNRELLPPFFPVFRGSDGLFSQTMRVCRPGDMIGYLPMACYHDPPESRTNRLEEVWSSSIRMVDLLSLLVRRVASVETSGTVERNLRELGTYLQRIAESSTSRFMDTLAGLWVEEMSRSIESLEYLLALYDYRPKYWAEHVTAYIDSIKARATSANVVVDDLSNDSDEGKGEILCQELVTAFGKLLYWWPLIWETARSLRSEEMLMFTQL
jgi:hypothetical protein